MNSWFSNFKKEKIKLDDNKFGKVEITFRHGGKGEPLLLLHGNPMSHVTWHKIVEELKINFTLWHQTYEVMAKALGQRKEDQTT